jgi:hypothetical protein
MRGEIVPSRFDQQQLCMKTAVEVFQGEQVCGNVLTDCRVRAPTGFNRADSLGFEGMISNQKLAVLFGENVIGHGGNVHFVAKFLAQRQHKGGFATADRPADADGECAVAEVSGQRPGALVEMAGAVEMFVCVAVA